MEQKKSLIILTGPTAAGKTKLSIGLAKSIGGEIISADSMQVYKKMDIGTAKIRPEEMDGVPHYLVDEFDPSEEFNVVVFVERAKAAMEKIYAAGHIPIIVGGTGFYIQALLYDIDFSEHGVEILMVFVSLSLVPLMYKPSSESHPFGYQQIESLFVVVKGAIMIAVTVGLIINNIQIIFHGGQHVNFSMVAYFEMSATLVSIAVIFLLRRMNSKLTSPIVIMEIQEWQIDSVASFGMCIAFFLPQIITGEWFQPLIPYLDPILAIILSLFMLPVPIKTVITGLRDLFLLPPEEETVQEIKDIVSPILATYGDTKLYYDILRTGRKLWISVYITMNRDMISISKFKSVQKEIIQALSKEYQDFYFELLPDIEYNGDTEVPEPVPDEEEA